VGYECVAIVTLLGLSEEIKGRAEW